MTTIDVKVTPKENVDISLGKALQEIEVVNVPEQEIDIIELNGFQNINITNDPEQDIGVEEDIKTIKIYDNAPEYEGEYEVTPKIEAQTLPTAERLLMKDVKIEKIPYFEVSNNSGGITASIGEV